MAESTRISLLEAVRHSDEEAGRAWKEFIAVYDDWILMWLLRQGVQRADAEDIRQQAMLTILGEIKNFQHNGRIGAFRNWVRSILRNRLREHHRKVRRKSSGANLEVLADGLEDQSSRLSNVWEVQHEEFLFGFLLRQVSKQFQKNSIEAFRRVAINQESAADVAEDLGMTLGAVRVAQHRVLRTLKDLGQGILD